MQQAFLVSSGYIGYNLKLQELEFLSRPLLYYSVLKNTFHNEKKVTSYLVS